MRGCCSGDSVHPPPPMPRWANALEFVIPTGAQRKGGTCCSTFGQKRMCCGRIASGFRFSINQTTGPSLRYAPVGMTKLKAAARLGMGGGGWTEHTTAIAQIYSTLQSDE
jgi:hypothetical protein